jgi:uncharacterized protein (TIGR02246 family)
MRRPLILLSFFVAAACAPKPAATTDTTTAVDTGRAGANTKQSVDDAKAAIGKARQAWQDGANKKDSMAVANLYTDDAEFVGPQGPPAKGKDAVRHGLAQSFATSSVKSIDSHDTQVSGDVGYDYGEFTQDVTPPGQKAQTVHGYYLVGVRRQADGSWKIARHVSVIPPAGTNK